MGKEKSEWITYPLFRLLMIDSLRNFRYPSVDADLVLRLTPDKR